MPRRSLPRGPEWRERRRQPAATSRYLSGKIWTRQASSIVISWWETDGPHLRYTTIYNEQVANAVALLNFIDVIQDEKALKFEEACIRHETLGAELQSPQIIPLAKCGLWFLEKFCQTPAMGARTILSFHLIPFMPLSFNILPAINNSVHLHDFARPICASVGSPKAMTLIAGVRCIDGFLVAADTALSVGDTMYHGQKIDHDIGRDYRIVIAGAGDLPYAQTASRQIKIKLREESEAHPSTFDNQTIVNLIQEELRDVHAKHIFQFWNANREPAPAFSLIIGVEYRGLHEILATHGTTVTNAERYVFNGSGFDLALSYGELLLRNSYNDSMTLYTATAVHIIHEIFRIVKKFRAGVGFDTRIFAWRTDDSPAEFFMHEKDQTIEFLWPIQENLKHVVWAALEQSESDKEFDTAKNRQASYLESLRKLTKIATKSEKSHFIRYTTMGEAAVSEMISLDRKI